VSGGPLLALDAMGGDDAPGAIVRGARQAVSELGVEVLLVGLPDAIAGADPGDLEVLACTEVIGMHDDPGASVRTKKDSSLVRAAEAVRDGRASAMISAGNTGATMASALLRMGRVKGVKRPAIATPIPVPGSTPTVLLDAGANADCQAEWLVQFAQMGSVFARSRFGVEAPRVGLLSIGEEDTKGNALVKEAHGLLLATEGIRFVGNVEGRDVMSADVDVVVTDGFTGNVVLKTLEGGMRFLQGKILEAASSTPERMTAFQVLWPALEPVVTELDPDTYGGAMLLGVDGVCIISHGSSSDRAIVNALGVAREMVAADLVGAIAGAVVPLGGAPAADRLGRRVRATGPRWEPNTATAPRWRRQRGAPVPSDTAPMDRAAVFEIIRDRLADILEIEASSISEGQSFTDDLEADSLALIELVEAIEEAMSDQVEGFRIEDDDLEDLKTVRDAVDYVCARLS
jgi:glycerol-3-phosphate acyltransferase PlsX